MKVNELVTPVFEGVGPTKELFQRAKNAGITFGCEAEFVVKGALAIIQAIRYKKTSKDIRGNLLKAVNDLTYYDIVYFIDVTTEKYIDIDNRIHQGIIKLGMPYTNPIEGWEALKKHYGPVGALSSLHVFPTYGFKLSDMDNENIKQQMLDRDTSFPNHVNKAKVIVGPHTGMTYSLHGEMGYQLILTFLAQQLSKHLGETVVANTEAYRNRKISNNYAHWILTLDGSIKVTDKYESFDQIGVELISSVKPLSNATETVQKVFNIISDFGSATGNKKLKAYTNESCGFHMSFGNLYDMDYVKLLTLYRDDWVLKRVKRIDNVYTKSTFSQMLHNLHKKIYVPEIINTFEASLPITSQDMAEVLKLFSSFNKIKESSINLGKLSDGIIEVRSIGNAGYETTFEYVSGVITHMSSLFYVSTNPSLFKNEYYKKIYKIVSQLDKQSFDTVLPTEPEEYRAAVKRFVNSPEFAFVRPLRNVEIKAAISNLEKVLYRKSYRISQYEFNQVAMEFINALRQSKMLYGGEIKKLYMMLKDIEGFLKKGVDKGKLLPQNQDNF